MVKKKSKVNSCAEIRYIFITVCVVAFVFLIVMIDSNYKVSMPEVVLEPNNYWNNTVLVKISKDSVSRYRLIGYKYCINTSNTEDNCDWKDTYTKNFEVYQNGVNYVFIKGMDEKENLSKSIMKIIRIDNDAPDITNVNVENKTENEITIKVDAYDLLTSIKYYYSINGGEYVEGNNTFTFKELSPKTNYQIRVRAIDEVGNKKEVGINESTN